MKRHPLLILADVLESEIDAIALDADAQHRPSARKLRIMGRAMAREMRAHAVLVAMTETV